MRSNNSDKINNILEDKGFCEQLVNCQLYKSLNAFQLKNASHSARQKISTQLNYFTFFERMQNALPKIARYF